MLIFISSSRTVPHTVLLVRIRCVKNIQEPLCFLQLIDGIIKIRVADPK
jgi:hypothetical protein